jgi:hypothetical protein
LANLAIQRHMSDAEFLAHLRQLPDYQELMAHFSDALKTQMAADKAATGARPVLASACLKDIERLERQVFSGAIMAQTESPGSGQPLRASSR